MKEEEIQLYNTYNETKASVVERVIRTLKTRMWRYFTAKRTMRYIDVLPDLVDSYNRSKHRSIQKKPINVTQNNEREVWHTLVVIGCHPGLTLPWPHFNSGLKLIRSDSLIH